MLRSVPSPFVKPVYLSYRKGGSVFWTRKPVDLPPGETLLTDGVLYARARCGNQVSEYPQEPVAEVEPAEVELNETDSEAEQQAEPPAPDVAAVNIARAAAAAMPERSTRRASPGFTAIRSGTGFTRYYPLSGGSGGIARGTRSDANGSAAAGGQTESGNPQAAPFIARMVIPDTPVPEPGTVVMIGLGLAALGVTEWKRRRHGV